MAAKPSLDTHVTLQTFMGHLVGVTHPKHYIPHSSPHTPYAHTPLPPTVNFTALNTPPHTHITLIFLEAPHTLLTNHINSSQGEKIT